MSGPYGQLQPLDIDYDRESWRAEAACAGSYNLMFDRDQEEAAKALCDLCPVIAECDAYAAEFKPPAGIWAGIDSKKRKRARLAAMKRARERLKS